MRMHNLRQASSLHGAAGGWSLIELLVVVGIIAILLAILVNTSEAPAPAEKTRSTLAAIKAIHDEFEASTHMAPSHAAGIGGNSIERFCAKVNTLDRTRGALKTLGSDVAIDLDNDGDVDTIHDAWGTVIQFFDGSSLIAEPGMPASKAAYFASAGANSLWGTVNPTTNTLINPADDNLFSFNVGR